MKSKYPKMNLKYAEAEEINELSELYIKIYDLKDTDIYMFVRFYFYLVNYRVENLSNKDLPICSEKIWPYLNRSKTALKELVYNNDDSEYKEVRKYICNVFEKENCRYLKKINSEYFELLDKVAKSKAIQIEYETNKEFNNLESEYGLELNNVWMTLELIRFRVYSVNVLRVLKNEETKEKRNFLLGIFLGAVGMLVSIVFGVIPFLK